MLCLVGAGVGRGKGLGGLVEVWALAGEETVLSIRSIGKVEEVGWCR